jgi:hypothetical protein
MATYPGRFRTIQLVHSFSATDDRLCERLARAFGRNLGVHITCRRRQSGVTEQIPDQHRIVSQLRKDARCRMPK